MLIYSNNKVKIKVTRIFYWQVYSKVKKRMNPRNNQNLTLLYNVPWKGKIRASMFIFLFFFSSVLNRRHKYYDVCSIWLVNLFYLYCVFGLFLANKKYMFSSDFFHRNMSNCFIECRHLACGFVWENLCIYASLGSEMNFHCRVIEKPNIEKLHTKKSLSISFKVWQK